MTNELAKSYAPDKYWVSNPVLGLRVGALSFAKVLSMICSEKTIPSCSKVFTKKLCTGQNVSSGKLSVPNPSWLVTMTNSKSNSLAIFPKY